MKPTDLSDESQLKLGIAAGALFAMLVNGGGALTRKKRIEAALEYGDKFVDEAVKKWGKR